MRARVTRVGPLVVLGLLAVLNLARGAIHAFSPDGGARSIAGLDLSGNRQTILSLFATLGLGQIVAGLFQLFVLVFRRDLIAIALGYQLAATMAAVFNLYFYRVFPVQVPGAPFNVAVLIVVALAFLLSLGAADRPTAGPAR